MTSWTSNSRRLGICSASIIVVLSMAYIATGLIWLWSNTATARSQGLAPGQPFLAILETLILFLTPALVGLFAAVHAFAEPDHKIYSLTAFGFAVVVAGITGANHFVQITSVHRMANANLTEAFALYDPAGRLTPVLALDLFAWDFLFGFALLFAAVTFHAGKLQRAIRVCLTLGGVLCLSGTAGPLLGNFAFQYLAILGYAFVFPLVSLLLAVLFLKSRAESKA